MGSISIHCRTPAGTPATEDSAIHASLTTRLKRLGADGEKAQELADSLSGPDTPLVLLRPMVTVDPQGGENALLVCANCNITSGADHVTSAEWFTEEQFAQRLNRLKTADGPAVLEGLWRANGRAEHVPDVGDILRLRSELEAVRAERNAL